jgi:hypothetical protein
LELKSLELKSLTFLQTKKTPAGKEGE